MTNDENENDVFKRGEKIVFKDAYKDDVGIPRCYWKAANFIRYFGDEDLKTAAVIKVPVDSKERIVSTDLLFKKDSEHGWVYNDYSPPVVLKKVNLSRYLCYALIVVFIIWMCFAVVSVWSF